jgi:hypothetical protein
MDEKPVSESQVTSRKPGSCRETGEEFPGEHPFPLGDKMEKLPRAAQQVLTLRTAELLRRHGTGKAVAGGGGATLLDQLATLGQRGRLHPQPSQHAPDRAVVQGPFFHGGRPRRRLIAGRSLSRAGCLPVGLLVVLHVAAGKLQEGRAGIALIGEYESWGNR